MTEQQIDDPSLEKASFNMNDVDCELARATVRQLLQDLNGVRDIQFLGGGAVVTYHPLDITKEEICTAIRQSGYRATEIQMNADPAQGRLS
jgi:copper chaperone CopZ